MSGICSASGHDFFLVEEGHFILLISGACVALKEEKIGVINEGEKVRRL